MFEVSVSLLRGKTQTEVGVAATCWLKEFCFFFHLLDLKVPHRAVLHFSDVREARCLQPAALFDTEGPEFTLNLGEQSPFREL